MAHINNASSVAAALLLLVFLVPNLQLIEAQTGVCYGRNGNNLPSEQDVVNLYKSKGIARMRLYEPDPKALQALKGSGIGLILDVPRTKVNSLGSNPSAATQWVQTNVVPYASAVNFRYIAVGNEIEPSDSEAAAVLPAMQNVQNALRAANLNQIKVSTAIKFDLMATSSPPSSGVFGNPSYVNPIVNFLKNNNSPLLVNIYPYFSYAQNFPNIQLNYALFTAAGTVVSDPNNGLKYQNLFDAMVDSVYAALSRAGAPNVPVVVSESGWPSAGGTGASVQNAGTYYKNLIGHAKQGTPRKSGAIEVYLFAMFDENQKAAGVEQNFGLFRPNQQPKYQLSFN